MRLPSSFFVAMIAVMAFTANVRGNVTLPNVISDHMVLQQGIAVPIWGEAAAAVTGSCGRDTVPWLP